MKLGIVYGKAACATNEKVVAMESELRSDGHVLVYPSRSELAGSGCEMILSVGGDGTFLSVAREAASAGIPVLGVNLGRMGFLSENPPQKVAAALRNGSYYVENRALLGVEGDNCSMLALNEVAITRCGSSILGVKVTVDGKSLPTYWGDGLLVATPSGSTAYALSVGGPIVSPSSYVLIIAPVAPHNLNVRPLIVPQDSRITLSFESREDCVNLSADNTSLRLPADSALDVRLAQFSLERVCLNDSNFIKALSEKLFWGEDVRNSSYE